jgi:HK97 family phage prohead protease
MSEIENTPVDERQMLARTFQTVDIEADGRNVEMLCVPFEVSATVVDPPPFGDGQPYEEQFARGAFASATKAPNRTLLEFEHWHPGLSGIIGHAAHLEERDDALYGRFRVTEHTDGDKALALIKDKVLTAASVFFEPIKSARSQSGAMRRLKVKLDRVALCRVGTWPQAQVIAVRTESVVVPEMEPVLPFDPELAEYLSAQGIAVPERLRPTTQ